MEIEDFGEKIGGAKKDLWKERGLSLDDLSEMNEAEKSKLIKKDNIWKKPDYQKMVQNGMPTRVAYFIKTIRDAIPTKTTFLSTDEIEERQKLYITFVSSIRDATMNLKTEDDVLRFYDNVIKNYLIKKENSYYYDVIPEARGFIDNKLLRVSSIKNFIEIDREISKKQFCYTEDEKILSNFDIALYDKENTKLSKESGGRTVIKLIKGYCIYYLYPKGELSNPSNWKENTFVILKGREVIKNNLESIEEAEQFILENFKDKPTEKINKKSRKKGFIPKQLEHISRTGEDYRNGKNVTGEDMMKTFNFKGGEFGNWLDENDRQQSLNYGYDALMDLSKALSISPADISLGNRLSIAFGSRGSGNAFAHYESDREVINLTKMKGAGSLAHEWGHALDDIVGKKLGMIGFATQNYKYSDSLSRVIRDVVDTMKYKFVSNEETLQNQKKEYEKQINRLKNLVNSLFPSEHLSNEQTELKDELIQNLINNAETASNYYVDYIVGNEKNKDIEDLSTLRKQTVGRVISKDDREEIARMQNYVFSREKQIGSPEKVQTEFYKNSIKFDDLYSKEGHGYWQDTIEMFARSFACYVADKLDNKSDYLCGHADLALNLATNSQGELELIKAFPEGKERENINEKIDKFINFLKERTILHDYNLENDYEDEYKYNYN